MALMYASGSPSTEFTLTQLRAALFEALSQLGGRQRVLAVPPDFTRFSSHAGQLTCFVQEHYQERLVDVLPALGTHFPLADWQRERMFPTIPAQIMREHRWREDVTTIGEVPADFVGRVTEGIYDRAWPVQLNRLVWSGGHDLILSIGQVVPHEVIGMANYNKNLFVGTGGTRGINESHFIGAAYGMERIMGRADTPLRRILNYAQDHFCQKLPLVFVLTVVGINEQGKSVVRGLFIGDDHQCYRQACALSAEVNITTLERPIRRALVYLDPEEFHSTWLGNKSIYRTRMALADDAELIVLAPGVKTFGEDSVIDRLIRKYGYRKTPEILQLVREQEDLHDNLAVAAHLIHGSSEGRFRVIYCPERLSREEIESVGYEYADPREIRARYDPQRLKEGWNETGNGESCYFIRNPALGLWRVDRGPTTDLRPDC